MTMLPQVVWPNPLKLRKRFPQLLPTTLKRQLHQTPRLIPIRQRSLRRFHYQQVRDVNHVFDELLTFP